MRMSGEDGKLLDERRGTLGRGAYLVELMRRSDLKTVSRGEEDMGVIEVEDTVVSPTKTPLYRGKVGANRPKSLEEEMLGA